MTLRCHVKSEPRIIGYRDLAKLAVAIEYELTRRTIAHTSTEEAATLIPA